LKYQPGVIAVLTWVHKLDRGPCMVAESGDLYPRVIVLGYG
jgi:hypothetical protein